MNVYKTTAIAVLVLALSVMGAASQHADATTQDGDNSDLIANPGMVTPDSALYGLETAWDNIGMAIGLKNAADVARERAGEARAMADQGNWEAAERAARGLEHAAARSDEDSANDVNQALSVLDGVLADAPEEARNGLQTAMENVRNAGPEGTPAPGGDGEAPGNGDVPSAGVSEDGNDTPAPDASGDDGEEEELPQPDDPDETGTEDDDTQEQILVTLDNSAFSPDTIDVAPDQELVFANNDNVDHTVTIPDADIDEELAPGDRYTVTLDEEGEYALDCTIHPGMDGTITVEQ